MAHIAHGARLYSYMYFSSYTWSDNDLLRGEYTLRDERAEESAFDPTLKQQFSETESRRKWWVGKNLR